MLLSLVAAACYILEKLHTFEPLPMMQELHSGPEIKNFVHKGLINLALMNMDKMG